MTIKPLKSLEKYTPIEGPVVLVIMDGLGIGEEKESNAVFTAHTPTLDVLYKEKLFCSLKAHGKAVGLPSDDDMGNSEVGHNALGAGRVFSQGAKLVDEAIASGTAFTGESWGKLKKCADAGNTVHFIGLLSDGNVHSNVKHLYIFLEQCRKDGIRKVRLHTLLDGRDVEQKSALEYTKPLEAKLQEYLADGFDYKIASGGGRMVTTMDRYNADWSIVERGWNAHVLGDGRDFRSASEAVQAFYDEDETMTDQYMPAFVVTDENGPVGTIEDGDAVVCVNFRGDRAIEISQAFEDEDFTHFDRKRHPKVFYAGMMEYDGDAKIPNNFLVEPPLITKTLGEYLCHEGVRSYAISETQKFGHVTYFYNGNKSGYINEDLETYVEVPSDKITFEKRPWMKAGEITDLVIDEVKKGSSKFIRLNYANADMVGHTGVDQAVRIAVESVDLCLGRLLEVIKAAGGIAIMTADHGNADIVWKEKNGKRTPMVAHTLNPVPCIIKDYSGKNTFDLAEVQGAGIANVASTICNALGFEAPEDYEPSLIKLS